MPFNHSNATSPLRQFRLAHGVLVADLAYSPTYIKRIEEGMYYELPKGYIYVLNEAIFETIDLAKLVHEQEFWHHTKRREANTRLSHHVPPVNRPFPIVNMDYPKPSKPPEVSSCRVLDNPFVTYLGAQDLTVLGFCRILAVPLSDVQRLVDAKAGSVPGNLRTAFMEAGLVDVIVKLSGQYAIYRHSLAGPVTGPPVGDTDAPIN